MPLNTKYCIQFQWIHRFIEKDLPVVVDFRSKSHELYYSHEYTALVLHNFHLLCSVSVGNRPSVSAWTSILCTIFSPNIEDLEFSPQIYLFYKDCHVFRFNYIINSYWKRNFKNHVNKQKAINYCINSRMIHSDY